MAVPRFTTAITEPGEFPLGAKTWRKSELALPAGAPRQWKQVLTGDRLKCEARSRTLLPRDIFSQFPVALLRFPS